ncbi:hypothetical protein BDZ94DRAFT_1268961 [Collybia nuda]|uniref:Uncharacterized protein n=1 Tax=Collybia nuda TaxID=64659 RepID=A0A9P6CFN4_9AGAR|nr:hypothetical protein BDZ94DRAFT_1268961 [Collybia nuda]
MKHSTCHYPILALPTATTTTRRPPLGITRHHLIRMVFKPNSQLPRSVPASHNHQNLGAPVNRCPVTRHTTLPPCPTHHQRLTETLKKPFPSLYRRKKKQRGKVRLGIGQGVTLEGKEA